MDELEAAVSIVLIAAVVAIVYIVAQCSQTVTQEDRAKMSKGVHFELYRGNNDGK